MLFALSYHDSIYVKGHRVQVLRWVPISPEQAIPGQIVSDKIMLHLPGDRVTFPVIGEPDKVLIAHSVGQYRELAPGE